MLFLFLLIRSGVVMAILKLMTNILFVVVSYGSLCEAQNLNDSKKGRPQNPTTIDQLNQLDQAKRSEMSAKSQIKPQGLEFASVEKLIGEQKYNEAIDAAVLVLKNAREKNNTELITRGLIKTTQLKLGLHGYETGVRYLKAEKWPSEPTHQVLLHLYYAQALTLYHSAYDYEIRTREKTSSTQELDLKTWTSEQISNEIGKSYDAALSQVDRLSGPAPEFIKEFIQKNNYPSGVRPHLRDAVVYMSVAHFANKNYWTPEQMNYIYKLPLSAFLKGEPLKVETSLMSHPLTKIAQTLNQHKAYHDKGKNVQAALEAQYERILRYFSAFEQKKDRTLILGELKKIQLDKEIMKLDWWSTGQWHLATLTMQDSENAERMIEAMKAARAGFDMHPGTVGATNCKSVIESIEQPQYHLLAMTSDSPEKASLLVQYKNLKKMYFRAYRYDVLEKLKDTPVDRIWNYDQKNNPQSFQHGVLGEPVASWSFDLEPTTDYLQHRALVTPPMKNAGSYIIFASTNSEFSQSNNQIVSSHVIITNLVMVRETLSDGAVEIQILNSVSGNPVSDVDVTIWSVNSSRRWDQPAVKGETLKSNSNGVALFSRSKLQSSNAGKQAIFSAKSGAQVALDTTYFWIADQKGANAVKPVGEVKGFIYTDRSIYRPDQKVLWKTVAFNDAGTGVKFSVVSNQLIDLKLMDSNGKEVGKVQVKTNSHGSASGEFTIPGGRGLGQWSIEATVSGQKQRQFVGANFSVEEYKRPTFEAVFKDADVPLRLNQRAKLKGEAKYYFGLPVASGKVKWRVSREPVFPWWWEFGFHFWRRPAQNAETIASGISEISADGSFHVDFLPEVDERNNGNGQDISYRFKISADVTDEGGETRHAEKSVRLGFVSVEARMNPIQGFFVEFSKFQIPVSLTNLDGIGRKGSGNWRIVELQQPEQTQLPAELPRAGGESSNYGEDVGTSEKYLKSGDRRRARWDTKYSWPNITSTWKDGTEISRGVVVHQESGQGTIESVNGLKSGVYRVHYETKDDFGALFKASLDILVAGKKTKIHLPFLFIPEKNSYRVGETARVLVHSGLQNQNLTFNTYRRAQRTKNTSIGNNGGGSLVEIPIREEDRGGFSLSAHGLRDHQLMRSELSVAVPWENMQLKIEKVSFRDQLRPGSKESVKFIIKDYKGKVLPKDAAEVLSYMYDRSLDFFRSHGFPSPISYFPTFTGIASPAFSLGHENARSVTNELPWPRPAISSIPDRLVSLSNYGIGGLGSRGSRGMSHMMTQGVPSELMESESLMRAEPMSAPGAASLEQSRAGGGASDKVGVQNEAKKSKSREEPSKSEASGDSASATQLRSNFSETAFFAPHLLNNNDGSVSIEFQVPDSLTAWNFWIHALTKDFMSGSSMFEAKSVKDLMVRPYVPRFVREGDEAELKVNVNNATDAALGGEVKLEITDSDTGKKINSEFGVVDAALKQKFNSPGKGSSTVSYFLKIPKKVGQYALKITASSGDISDGERRPLVVLPSRLHLAQSRFAILKDKANKTLEFKELENASSDPSLINEKMVVSIDGQLFYGVLQSLPYLINYPYECVEQTLNRFLSTGIVSSVFSKYPAIEKMAREFSKRETQVKKWDATDPNRRMSLEESPWLEIAEGGQKNANELANVLDSRIAKSERDISLEKLRKMQLSSGGFPWFPGGRENEYMTLYVLVGFARAGEFKVDVPKDVIEKAWRYLKDWTERELKPCMSKKNNCSEMATLIGFALSSYPDLSWTGGVFSENDKKEIADYSFKNWKTHSPLLKAYLALTLHRMKRADQAKLVWASVMDSAKSSDELGTYWAPEDRSWLWYNDTIESHAFALRTQMELDPKSKKNDGLVQWLFLNKKLNHWKSTRATAEVIYSLVHYLEKSATLGKREQIKVSVAGKSTNFTFEPEKFTGEGNRLIVEGLALGSKSGSKVIVEKSTPGFAFASAVWHYSTDILPKEAHGDFFSLKRNYFVRELSENRENKGKEWILRPLKEGAKIKIGDQIEVQISLRAKHEAEYVHLRDPRGAGFEPETQTSRYKYDLGLSWYEEVRDSGTNFFFNWLPVGEYTFKYRLRANMNGKFRVGPASIQSMYAPEFNAFSSGTMLVVQ